MDGVIMIWCAVAIVAAGAFFAARKRAVEPFERWLYWLNFVVPFAYGGFYTYLAAPFTAVLLAALCQTVRKNGKLTLYFNWNTIAVLLVVLGYFVTPLWAADKGSAVFGIIRFVPLALYLLLLMQWPKVGVQELAEPVAYSGAVMTVVSLGSQFVPALSEYVTVNGRLAGFFGYPNTFAIFLLAGLIMLMLRHGNSWLDWVASAVLIFGTVASGSRTAFVFLLVAIVLILMGKRKVKTVIILAVAVAFGIAASALLSSFTELHNANRFTTITDSPGTFIGRLLYYRDALGVIATHPFGLGYWGYRVLEGSFQTGRYYVAFVHNGLLQLLLDIGWIPALLLAFCFLRAIFSKKTDYTKRALLLLVLGHCMLDFDLQYFTVWMLLLPMLDLHGGRELSLKKPRVPVLAVGAVLLAVCVWLGLGDWFMQMGYSQKSLAVTPFRTEALEEQLAGQADMEILDATAEKILSLCPSSSIAHSAKANVAYSKGDVLTMMEEKEQAIRYAKYTIEEYTDYLDKLFAVYQVYAQMGDTASAQYCAQKILAVPTLIQQVTENTSWLAENTRDDNSLELPAEYLQVIEQVRQIYG